MKGSLCGCCIEKDSSRCERPTPLQRQGLRSVVQPVPRLSLLGGCETTVGLVLMNRALLFLSHSLSSLLTSEVDGGAGKAALLALRPSPVSGTFCTSRTTGSLER